MTTQTDTLRKALEVARQYVKLQNRAEGIFEGVNGRKPRPSDADLKMIDEAIVSCQQAQETQPVLAEVVEAHCADLDRCVEALAEYPKFEATAKEISTAAIELREALYAAAPAKPAEISRKVLTEFIDKFCLGKSELIATAEAAFHAFNLSLACSAKPADPIQFLVDQAQELDMGYGKPADHIPDATEMIAKPAEAEQQAPHDGPPITAWVSINRVSGGKTLAFHKVTSGHDATLYSHIALREQAPAITEQAPPLPKELVRIDMNDDSTWGELTEHAWDSDFARDLALNAPLFTLGQLRERDAMWMAKIAALRSEQTPAGESERDAFEQWFASQYSSHKLTPRQNNCGIVTDGYADTRTDMTWGAWQARAALSTPPAVPPGWQMVPEKLTQQMSDVLTEMLTNCHSVEESYSDLLSAAPAAPQWEQPK